MKKKKEKKIKKDEIVIYRTKDGPKLDVHFEQETVWLKQDEIAKLFGKERSVISKHINKIFKDKEVGKESNVHYLHIAKSDKPVAFYSLDVILSVGYRTSSSRAIHFRQWASGILNKYLIHGYAINKKYLLQAENKFKELKETISFLQTKARHDLMAGQEQEILTLLNNYAKTLTLLKNYDHNKLSLAKKSKAKFILYYKEAREVVAGVKKELINKREASDLFGQENTNKFEAILGNIYQTFGGKDLYTSLEEKAAHLLYFVIKDHPFVDGNKRVGAFLFVYFLDRNNFLYRKTGEKKINDNALTALSLLIAISDPKEKDKMIKIITNLLSE
ncbi:MAG TPA: hypothetical protein DEB09_04895 [Candidatus Magasanikbacteria bacterium]|nr:hypothetical protein [Candidatus Magasanikbacteria bacterium]